MKYKKEWLTGKLVGDNKESKMDEKFLDLQMEKSTEGLSESSVQFMVQTVFFVFLISLSLLSVIMYIYLENICSSCFFQNELGTFISFGGVKGGNFVTEWGEWIFIARE